MQRIDTCTKYAEPNTQSGLKHTRVYIQTVLISNRDIARWVLPVTNFSLNNTQTNVQKYTQHTI
jgi:hypothetical protein